MTKSHTQESTRLAVRVIENFMFPHRGGPMLTEYRKGEVVFGEEAREIAHRPEVAVLGEESTFRLCPAIDCGAHVPVETIRAGEVRVLNAHRAIAPVKMMLGERWIEVPSGGVLEMLWAPETARTILELAGEKFERSGLDVYRATCPTCSAPADYTIAPDARGRKISAGGDDRA